MTLNLLIFNKGGEAKMTDRNNSSGKKRLIRQYRKKFRTKENLNHYSDKDFRAAEKNTSNSV